MIDSTVVGESSSESRIEEVALQYLAQVLKDGRYECHPICADLQAQILQCYRQNTQQTLSCSTLANQYKRCVNQAKQVPLSTESENHSPGAHWPELHERSSTSQRSCQGSPLSGDAELLVTAYQV
ncbi:hypothetical protein J1605_009581 [Eschrichtius robustus]|uniref:Coiled-coil-helix-coiled-coil-helix domain-containing protein 3, mitochondrial n=1 Tax=Eschrichtius robustus TaxID=9764 RepID=A0AB34GSD2_ESCRO|nr:hypothetical protein J1605_009581 [Eschrichtius robustus]